MHMLQDAHAAVHAAQQQHQQLPQVQLPMQHVAQQQQQQPVRTRLHRQRAQQQSQQSAHSAVHSTDAWAQLAAVVTAAQNNVRTSWPAQQAVSLAHHAQAVKQLFLRLAPAALAAQRQAQTAAQGAAGTQEAVAAAGSHAQPLPGSQPDFLQWFVQHLLGVLVALNLLLHRHLVLDTAAAAGAWLQQHVLQPHIDWLTQAHPGERSATPAYMIFAHCLCWPDDVDTPACSQRRKRCVDLFATLITLNCPLGACSPVVFKSPAWQCLAANPRHAALTNFL